MFPHDRAMLPFAIAFFIIGLLFLAQNTDDALLDWFSDDTFVAQDNDINFDSTAARFVTASVTYDGQQVNFALQPNETDTPADEECPTWEVTGSAIEWQTCGAGGGGGALILQEDASNLTATTTLDFDQGILAIDVGGSKAVARIVLTEGTLTDDQVLVGSSSNIAASLAIANCASAGNALNYDTATNTISCRTLADADIPDTITIDLAATATALAANGANCSAGQAPLGVDASGAVEGCFTPSGGGGGTPIILQNNGVTLAATRTIDFDQGLLAIDIAGSVARIRAQIVGATLTTDQIWVGSGGVAASQALSATNVGTATALAANPTDCGANEFADAIAASGNLTCNAIVDADVPDTITIDLAATATALAANPTDCAAGTKADAIAASGNLTCSAVDISADTNLGDGNYLTFSADTLSVDAEIATPSCTVDFLSVATATSDSGFSGPQATCYRSTAFTLDEIFCITDGTLTAASVSFDEVTRGGRYGAGSSVADTVPWNCTSSGNTITVFTDDSIAADSAIRMSLGTRTGDVGSITIVVDVTIDD